MGAIVTKAKGEKFRDRLKQRLIDHENEFWEAFDQLPCKDKCEMYLKVMPYAFSKAPEEKPIGAEDKQMLILEETKRKATLIAGGIQDQSFEEEEEDAEVLEN